MSEPAGQDDGRWRELEALAPSYQLPALLQALQRLGLGRRQISFDSRDPDEASASQVGARVRLGSGGSLVRGVRLDVGPPPRAVVYLDMGLFSATSPLPDYFQRLLGERAVGENLALVLRTLDDGLLRARARAESREFSGGGAWEQHLAEALVGDSPRYVDQLFRQIFPELRVRVGWRKVPRTWGLDRVALGSATLGSCAFDGRGVVEHQGLEVTLTAAYDLGAASEHLAADQRQTWVQEVKRRLGRYILPRYRRRPIALTVRLRILERAAESRIDFARVGEGVVPAAALPFSVVLYEGKGRAGQVSGP